VDVIAQLLSEVRVHEIEQILKVEILIEMIPSLTLDTLYIEISLTVWDARTAFTFLSIY
jgi:hypothetical protein